MRPIVLFFTVIVTWAMALTASATEWQTYGNARYGFTMQYPAGLFHTREASENGDGVTWKSKDGKVTLLMYGIMNGDELPLETIMGILTEDSDGRNIVYKRTGDNWIVISAYEKEDTDVRDIFYQRLVAASDLSKFSVFEITYPETQRETFDPLLKRMGESLTPPRAN